MRPIPSQIDSGSAEFVTAREAMLAQLETLRERTAEAREGGRDSAIERHRERGKLFVRDRIELLLDDDSPFLEFSALAAWELYEGPVPGAGIVTRLYRSLRKSTPLPCPCSGLM